MERTTPGVHRGARGVVKGDIVVILATGDEIDISDLSPAAAVQLLRDRQITPADIRETRHTIRTGAIARPPANTSRPA